MNIKITKSTEKKQKPDQTTLGFGQYFTDHMFVMEYEKGKGWHNPEIQPYAYLNLSPAAMVFHYGQAIFEGLKAYLSSKGEILLFRPDMNVKRLNMSCEKLCIPVLDPDLVMEAMLELVKLDADWIPKEPGTSLYIRPFVFATDPFVGVRASYTYKFLIILSPVGAYYAEGFNPVKIYVEQHYVRAVKGGIGEAKAAANYAASLKAQTEAKEKGYSQVLWLDGVERKYIEEVGTMNVFFKINNEIITPALNGSILGGITRNSVIELLKDLGYTVSERKISIDEIIKAQENGTLEEVFGSGTAAVISPVGELAYGDRKLVITQGQVGELSQRLYDILTGIQIGTVPDKFNWVMKVK